MTESNTEPISTTVEELLRNQALRTDLEPYYDESVEFILRSRLSLKKENEYLESILEWERAPSLPVKNWFNPALEIPAPQTLSDEDIHKTLWDVIYLLYEKKIVFDFCDHLSDREFYTIIYRDILPCHEKMLNHRDSYLHWDCADISESQDIWLTFYASDDERSAWQDVTGGELPQRQIPPYIREMPL